jgi:hypothetical protein
MTVTSVRDLLQTSATAANAVAKTPFDLYPVIQAPLGREEFLELLRERINKGYMPTSKGSVQYNRKPEYLQNLDTSSPDALCQAFLPYWPGYFSEDTYGVGGGARKLWVFLNFETWVVLVDLQTEQTWVAVTSPQLGQAHEWTDQLISVDRFILLDRIDIHC